MTAADAEIDSLNHELTRINTNFYLQTNFRLERRRKTKPVLFSTCQILKEDRLWSASTALMHAT